MHEKDKTAWHGVSFFFFFQKEKEGHEDVIIIIISSSSIENHLTCRRSVRCPPRRKPSCPPGQPVFHRPRPRERETRSVVWFCFLKRRRG